MFKEFFKWFFTIRGTSRASKILDIFAKSLITLLFIYYPVVTVLNLLVGRWEMAFFNAVWGVFFLFFNFMLWFDSFMRDKSWEREKKLLEHNLKLIELNTEAITKLEEVAADVALVCGMYLGKSIKHDDLTELKIVQDIAKKYGVTHPLTDITEKPAAKRRGRPKKVDPAITEALAQ